jgi:hypothetical protein
MFGIASKKSVGYPPVVRDDDSIGSKINQPIENLTDRFTASTLIGTYEDRKALLWGDTYHRKVQTI